MRAGGILAGLIAIPAAAVSIASAVVRSDADEARISSRLWPDHPLTLRSMAMAQIGEAAARGQVPSPRTMERVRLLAGRAPLEPEPFLIEAALALKSGDSDRTGRLLVEARRRDPRSPAARFLMADHLIRTGDIVGGLREVTVLSRIFPAAAEQLVPALAAYARTPGAVPKLRQLFRQSPDLEPVLLSTLASEAENADIIIAIARPQAGPDNPGPWRAKLLNTLVHEGMYAKAFQIWLRFTGASAPRPGLFRPDFEPTSEPPPFNWTLAQSGGGLAEPARGGGLRVLHYGRNETLLATQVMLLPAGRHQLSMTVSGDVGADGQLRWRIVCLPSGPTVFDLPLTRGNAGRAGGQFQVPPSRCEAQRIDLLGTVTETPKSSDATITRLRLVTAGGQ